MNTFRANCAAASLLFCSMAAAANDPYTRIIADQENGRYNEALSQISTLLKDNANDAQALLLKGNVSKLMGDTDQAASIFKQLINQYPSMPEPYNNLAVLYADKGQTALAIETLQQVFSTSDSYATAYKNLRTLYNQMASSAYREALDIDQKPKKQASQYALLNKTILAASVVVEAEPETAQPATPQPATSQSNVAVTIAQVTPAEETEQPPTQASTPVQTQQAVATVSTPAADDKNTEGQIATMIGQWSQAWSQRKPAQYFAFYHQKFIPPGTMNRKAWETYRGKRILRPKFIEIDVIGITVKQLSDSTATAIFEQHYRSDTYQDTVVKKLSLRKDQQKWLIVQEVTL